MNSHDEDERASARAGVCTDPARYSKWRNEVLDNTPWVQIPEAIRTMIRDECIRNQTEYTHFNLFMDFQYFVKKGLPNCNDPFIIDRYTNQNKIEKILTEEIISRAMQTPNSIGIKCAKDFHILDFICYYANKKSWIDTLDELHIDLDSVKVRTAGPQKFATDIGVKLLSQTDKILLENEVLENSPNISSTASVEVDKDIEPMLEELKLLLKENGLDKAEEIYIQAKELCEARNDDYSRAVIQRQYASILRDKYYNIEGEDMLLMDCLSVFQKYKKEEDIAFTIELLARTKASLGDLYSAEIFSNDYLDFARKKGKNDAIAAAYILVGYVYLQKDDLYKSNECMDEAIKYGTRFLHENENDKRSNGNEAIIFAYQNKSLIYKRLGDIQNAIAYALKALEGHRKMDKKAELGMMLLGLAELECYAGNFSEGKWKEYIEEAKSIFRELEDYSMLARCIDLVSQIAYSTGQKDLSLQILKDGYEEIKKTKDKEGIAYFLQQFASYFLGQKRYDETEIYLNELIEFAIENGLNKSITKAYEYLARIADRKGDTQLRDEFLNSVITSYEKQYVDEQSPVRKAEILCKIAHIKEQLNDLHEALEIYKKAAKIFEDLKITSEYARTLLIITELKIKLGDYSNLLANWQLVIQKVEGSAFYEISLLAKINIGSYLLKTGDYEMAQRYLEEAQEMIFKYKLRYAKEVTELLEEAIQKREIQSHPETTFLEMIMSLYEAFNSNNRYRKPILKHWFHKFEQNLYKHFYHIEGIRCFFFSDDFATIRNITQKLSWLFDFFLIVPNEKLMESKLDFFPYPYKMMKKGEYLIALNATGSKNEKTPNTYEELLLSAINKPTFDGRFPRYVIGIVKEDNKYIPYCCGWGKELPSILYEWIQRSKAQQIIKEIFFILHVSRYSLKDKFYADIIAAWEMKYIPVYLNEELKSDSISIICQIKTSMPFERITDSIKISTAKKLMNSLLKATKENASTILNDFKYDIEILFGEHENKISMKVMLVEISYAIRKIVYPVIILQN